MKTVTIHSTVLKYLLKPKTWKFEENMKFPINPKIINALCKEVIEVMKKEPMVIKLKPGVKIFGSLHG